jgi:hypothetical protein
MALTLDFLRILVASSIFHLHPWETFFYLMAIKVAISMIVLLKQNI